MTEARRGWDGAGYDRLSGPQEAWGREVLDRLVLAGDETVLDAGCGSGRVTAMLVDRLPRGQVIAVDRSASMVEAARRRLGTSAELHVMDLMDLALDRRVDAVLSTATFHWIKDHGRLFDRLAHVLRPGGRLAAQCGGLGNLDHVFAIADVIADRPPFDRYLAGWTPTYFADPATTEARLARAGFAESHCWLEPRDVAPDEPRAFLESIVFGAHVERLPDQLRAPFMDGLLAALDPPVLDYVRLNIDATR